MTDLLIIAYAQVLIVDLMCRGRTREQAAWQAWAVYYEHLFPLRASSSGVILRGYQNIAGRKLRYPCVASTAIQLRAELAAADPDGLDPEQLARVGWLLETVRRVAEGQPLLDAARGAHDAHLGKPRQRRRPAPQSWLAGEVTAAMDWLWQTLTARFDVQFDRSDLDPTEGR